MLQFKNRTAFQGTVFASSDPSGVDTLYAVVKGTFSIGNGAVVTAEEQLPVVQQDEYHGDPAETSIRRPSDLSLGKPGTDVLLIGSAHTPAGRAAKWLDVSLRVGPVGKVVRVVGDRFLRRDGVGFSITEPKPFTTMPLVWERAFGGSDVVESTPSAEARNPVGTGYRDPEGQKVLDGLPLPNLEDPNEPMSSWKQRPAPACFAPISPHWEPRRSYAGTYDQRWQREQAPYLPADFDTRFFQLAPADLVVPGHLTGGEPVEVKGATPSGSLTFELPAIEVTFDFVTEAGTQSRVADLDTVVIEPDESRLALVWRTGLSCDKSLLRTGEIVARAARQSGG
jgi:hypothetical protein